MNIDSEILRELLETRREAAQLLSEQILIHFELSLLHQRFNHFGNGFALPT